jgi:multiple sugar transport system substrate-binding protein
VGGDLLQDTAQQDSDQRSICVVALCLAVVALTLAACGGSGDSGGDRSTTPAKHVDMAAALEKPATITVWAWTPGTAEAAKMFEKAHPNIKVEVHNVGQGPPHYAKLRTALRSGRGLPDVVHMEFQYIPSFTLTKSLLDLTPYLPDDFLGQYPEWIQKQVDVQGGIYGIPWDTGPLGFIYRRDLLEKAGIKTPIRTWDEFARAAIAYHEANPKSYLVNMPGAETGQWLALFWQAGARPFSSDPRNLKIDLTSPEIKRVTEFWDKLYAAGAVSHDAGFADAWFQSFARGRYAGWVSAAWGPVLLQDFTRNSKGLWRAQELPQWNRGEHASGNWGGSTLAVLKGSKHPAAAAEFARWILSEQEPVEMFAFDRFLFPPLKSMLSNPRWLDRKYAFYGSQAVNRVYADMAGAVDTTWQWPPIYEYVASEGDAIRGQSVERGNGVTAALQPWQDAVEEYAEEQGLKVAGH